MVLLKDLEIMENLGNRIYTKRKLLKLSQAELAEKVGVSPQMISNLETGKKAIRPANLYNICKALGLSTDYALSGGEGNYEIDKIVNRLSSLDDNELQLLNSMIDYMFEAKK